MPAPLTLWLHRRPFGQVEQLRNRSLRLRFEPDVVRDFGVGACPLSLSLPLTTKRIEGAVLERWLDNLLPESFLRAALERRHGIRPGDTFAFLQVIGQECAGAVQFTTGDQPLGTGRLRHLSLAEVNRIVRDLPTLDPPDDLPLGASLGGVQAKVLLTRTATGWAWPTDGAMSTHLIKPEPTNDVVVPDLVRHEEWAMRLAARAGLPAARVELADFDGRTAIIVERYDRNHGARSHQEDFAQALGIAARDKYESAEPGPGRLARIAGLAGAQAADPAELRRDLLRAVAFNLVIGNGDAHSKNYSLRVDENAQFSLAPIYDAAPVYLLNDHLAHFGHSLAGQTRLPYLTAEHLIDEAHGWGLRRDRASAIVMEVLEAVAAAVPSTSPVSSTVDIAAAVLAHVTTLMASVSSAG
jgi:serine/threonine-protein kinase HipA